MCTSEATSDVPVRIYRRPQKWQPLGRGGQREFLPVAGSAGSIAEVRAKPIDDARGHPAVLREHLTTGHSQVGPTARGTSLLCLDEWLSKAIIHCPHEKPRASIAHPHATRGRGNRAGLVDRLEQISLAGPNRNG